MERLCEGKGAEKATGTRFPEASKRIPWNPLLRKGPEKAIGNSNK